MRSTLILLSLVSNLNALAQNVGIGTDQPAHKLDVIGNIRSGLPLSNVMNGTHPNHSTSTASWWKDGSDYSLLTDGINTSVNAPDGAGYLYLNTGSVQRLLINGSTGNVGIGIAPSYKLDILGNIRAGAGSANGIVGSHPGYAGNLACFWKEGSDYTLSTDGANTWVNAPSSSGGLNLAIGNTNRLSIGSNGNVAIGWSSTNHKLDVNGDIRAGSGAGTSIGTYSSGYAGLWRTGYNYALLTDGGQTYVNGSSGPLHLLSYNSIGVTLTGGLNVGIGTTNPFHKLHVVGNICYTGAIGACSDVRYKTNFFPIVDAVQSVIKLQPLYYHWKTEEFPEHGFTNERQLGFSAQEVEKLFPEVVQTDSKGYKTVDYSRLTPVLVQAVKEQQNQIAKQEERIEKLENLVRRLMKR